MMPPVSLPLNGGTHWACAGAPASIPHIATRLAAPIIRIANSIWLGRTLKRIGGHEKNGGRPAAELSAGVAALHLTSCGLRGTVPRRWNTGGIPMRDFFTSLKTTRLGAALGVVLGLLAFGQAAQAANPLELNFGLFGPRYDGRVKECEAALGTITNQFWEKESTFWNSALQDHRLWPDP